MLQTIVKTKINIHFYLLSYGLKIFVVLPKNLKIRKKSFAKESFLSDFLLWHTEYECFVTKII